jgi:hypothetical protein
VRNVVAKDLFSSAPLVNADHRNSDRPGSVSDRETEVGIVRLEILAYLHVVDDLGYRTQDVWSEVALAELSEQGLEVLGGLLLRRGGGFALGATSDVLCNEISVEIRLKKMEPTSYGTYQVFRPLTVPILLEHAVRRQC